MTPSSTHTNPYRVFLVEDHPVVRLGLKQIIGFEPGLEVCGEAETVEDAMQQIEELRPQVVLVDLMLPGRSGMELVRYIKRHWLGMKVIVVSTHDEELYGPAARQAGADCYINKHEAMDQIVQAIRSVTRKHAGPSDDDAQSSFSFG